MVIYNKDLSVAPLTTHIKLKEVSKSINKNLIMRKIQTLHLNYRKYFKKSPKIAVLGLNPHNFEFKKNSEELKIILPAIKTLKKNIIFLVLIHLILFFLKIISKNLT